MAVLVYLYLLAQCGALYRFSLPYAPIYWVIVRYLYSGIVYPATHLVFNTRLHSIKQYNLVFDTRLYSIGYYRNAVMMIMWSPHSYIIPPQLYGILCIGGACELWRFYGDYVKPIDKQVFALAQ